MPADRYANAVCLSRGSSSGSIGKVVTAAAAVVVAATACYYMVCRDVPHVLLSIVLPFAAGRSSHSFGTVPMYVYANMLGIDILDANMSVVWTFF